MKMWMIVLLSFIGLIVLLIAGFLFWISSNSYKPPKKEILKLTHQQLPGFLLSNRLHLASWNIGYAGLGKEMDFFYDGGKETIATATQSDNYLKGILNILKKNESIDIWLLQEVDKKAKRSYYKNEIEMIGKNLPAFNTVFATNYKVPFIPFPVLQPMGEVESGLMTMSVYSPKLNNRHAFPLIAVWPDSLFLPDRCFIETRIATRNGKELIVINTHNSAFITDKKLMDKELALIRNLMMTEFLAGNYVVAGGDWNMNPYNFIPAGEFNGHRYVPSSLIMNKSFMPSNWQVVSDNKVPSNRFMDMPYEKGKTGTTTIDFFVLSPNIKLNKMITVDLGFEFSDHNPVFIDIELTGVY
jgi:endonuclease/exonuclease/phosphatase family metal-dependent hydrolase